MLVLTTEGLRSRPQRSLDALCRFLGLPRINVTAAHPAPPEAAVAQLLETVYPQFGPRTGWRLEGDYEPMAPALRSRLQEYFAPFNRALRAYLEEDVAREIEADWAPRAAAA